MKQEVSCRIANSILAYTKDQKKNTDHLLRDLDASLEHLQDANSWMSMELCDVLFERVASLFYDDQIIYKIGRQSCKLGGWGVLDSVFRMIGDPKLIFHQSRKFISYFYKGIDLRVVEKSDFHVLIEFHADSKHERHLQYLQGAFESIPTYWQLGHAFSQKISTFQYEFRWENKQEFFGRKDAQVSLSPQLIQDTLIQLEKTISLIEKKNRQLEEKNEELIKSNTKLKETVKEKIQSEKMASIGHLATGVAHEMNNPLGFVMSNIGRAQEYALKLKEMIFSYEKGFQSLVEQGHTPALTAHDAVQKFFKEKEMDYVLEDFPKLLEESQEGLNRVHQTLKDLHNFARVAPEQMELSNLHEGIDSTLRLLRHELKNKVTVTKEYGQIPKIRCNLSKLNQVFLNLFMNAVQAIQDQGELKIRTEHEKNFVRVYISDTGCGIDPKQQYKIFEPFYSTKTQGQNMGLGLSTAVSIVKQHGGNIQVESQPGLGTCFTLTLPMAGIPDL